MQSQILNSLRVLSIQGLSETDRVASKAYFRFQVTSLWEFNIDVTFFSSCNFMTSTHLIKDVPAHGQVFGQDDTWGPFQTK